MKAERSNATANAVSTASEAETAEMEGDVPARVGSPSVRGEPGSGSGSTAEDVVATTEMKDADVPPERNVDLNTKRNADLTTKRNGAMKRKQGKAETMVNKVQKRVTWKEEPASGIQVEEEC